MEDDRSKILRRLVDQWVEESDGWFRTEDIWKQYNVQTTVGKNTVWQRLKELVETASVEKAGLRYRCIDKELEEVDIFSEARFVFIRFPFKLEDYFRLSEGVVMVIAGASGSGKTALCLNIAYLNMEDWEVHLFDSESGVALLRERLLGIDPNLSHPLPFRIWDRMDNFADVIKPGALNIIDYLDTDSEYYMVGAEIKRILKALNGRGVAIIAMQKPPPQRSKDGKLIARDLAYGGGTTIKKSEVYLSIDEGRLKIIKAKSRVDPRVNPVNKQWTFRLDNTGSNFIETQEWMV